MPAYNFQARFAPDVESGRKPHTIRKRRKHPTQPGQPLALYTGMRTRGCRLLLRTTVASVTPIHITARGAWVKVRFDPFYPWPLTWRRLSRAEFRALADIDARMAPEEFIDFFRQHYGVPTLGMELIGWTP